MIEETALYQGFDIGRVSKDVWMMVAIGVVQRVAAYFLLVGLNRDKQK